MADLEPRNIQMMHVVYADGVGYSKLSLAERSRFDSMLSEVVLHLPHADKVLAKVDNGDGFALAFGGDPQVAADTALWLLERFTASGQALVRLGIHTGVGYLRPSLAGPATLSGDCIEFAQRMMTLSNGKVIACSEAFRQLLLNAGSPSFIGLPIYGRSKHGELLIAYPLTLRKRVECLFLMAEHEWDVSTEIMNIEKYDSEIHVAWASTGRQEAMAHLLSHQSRADKIVVMPRGRYYVRLLGWDRRDDMLYIENSGTHVDEVIPHDSKVIHFSGSWLDAERLRIEILGTRPVLHVGEPVALASPLYIERPADSELRRAISNHESVILLRAARKFGKTSALLRAIHHAETSGVRPVVIDLKAATKDDFCDAQSFYQWIIEQLMLQSDGREYPEWEDLFGPNSNLESALRQVLAPQSRGNLLVLDGVDRLFDCEFRDDFFGLLRSWHNRRAMHSDPFWDSLSILLSYSAEGQSLVTDVNQSPFNVGVHLTLEPFSEAQTQELCAFAGWEGGVDVFSLTAGHPYLSAMLVSRLSAGDSVEAAISATIESPLIVRQRELLARNKELRDACAQIMREGHTDDQTSLWQLLAMGIFVSDKNGELRIGNRLFLRLLDSLRSKG